MCWWLDIGDQIGVYQMKWYSVKKYIPPSGSWVICRIWHIDGWEEYTTARFIQDYWDYGAFFNEEVEKKHAFEITHFCIPEPVEIED